MGISDVDKEIIYDNIRDSIIEMKAVEIRHPHEEQHQQPEKVPAPHEKIQQQPAEEDDIFDEIKNHYIDEKVHRGAEAENCDANMNAATIADAELTL